MKHDAASSFNKTVGAAKMKKNLSSSFSIASQITTSEIHEIAEMGFKTIINCRPDGENNEQPLGIEIEERARQHGISYRHIPIDPNGITDEDVTEIIESLIKLPAPIFAFCSKGKRATELWALSEAHNLDPEIIVKSAHIAGHDLEHLWPRLQARWQPERGI